jgi:hypothetical protein
VINELEGMGGRKGWCCNLRYHQGISMEEVKRTKQKPRITIVGQEKGLQREESYPLNFDFL